MFYDRMSSTGLIYHKPAGGLKKERPLPVNPEAALSLTAEVISYQYMSLGGVG
ncbi:MAG: hypothetical protein OP8BY_1286 [Candidatus Saccharicenans subterraneus]|uniref:Uncharacterized protein n=1 Tax=Candidatus Saccharicenans subterraneus TaxID=2508984 RepID=A0A3E2BPI0_9BACT|nr:MAG: hypothetical protein OP8BY_1286 [Candidatus Saccharicenans subterraneum]